jgi:hypothetical protein
MRRHGLIGALFRFRLLGGGYDGHLLPGDSSQGMNIYLVECSSCDHSYFSDKWERECEKCGSSVKNTER